MGDFTRHGLIRVFEGFAEYGGSSFGLKCSSLIVPPQMELQHQFGDFWELTELPSGEGVDHE